MKKGTKYFITFFAPGTIVANTNNVEISKTECDPLKIEWPDYAYCFELWKQHEIVDDDGTRYTGKREQIGPIYYHPDSKIETLEEVKVNPNKGYALVSNMESNKWDRVIWSRWGNWPQPYKEGKQVILYTSSD